MKRTREISVFVDESGSFVPESMDSSSRQYILCMVFHDQSIQIADEIAKLEDALFQMGLKRGHCVHAGPLVRRERSHLAVGVKKFPPPDNDMLAELAALKRRVSALEHISIPAFACG